MPLEQLRAQLYESIQKSQDSELAYQSQISQFMEHIREERNEQARLRTSLLDSITENKGLRAKLQSEYKKQFDACKSCITLR